MPSRHLIVLGSRTAHEVACGARILLRQPDEFEWVRAHEAEAIACAPGDLLTVREPCYLQQGSWLPDRGRDHESLRTMIPECDALLLEVRLACAPRGTDRWSLEVCRVGPELVIGTAMDWTASA